MFVRNLIISGLIANFWLTLVFFSHWRVGWGGIAVWKWLGVAADDQCSICRQPFDGCCTECKFPGEDCPLGLRVSP